MPLHEEATFTQAMCKSKGRDGRTKGETILNVWETTS